MKKALGKVKESQQRMGQERISPNLAPLSCLTL